MLKRRSCLTIYKSINDGLSNVGEIDYLHSTPIVGLFAKGKTKQAHDYNGQPVPSVVNEEDTCCWFFTLL